MATQRDSESSASYTSPSQLTSRLKWPRQTADDDRNGRGKIPLSELYPRWTTLLATVTTLFIALPITFGLLVGRGIFGMSVPPSLTVSVIELFDAPVYGSLMIGLALGNGVATAVWYVSRAPTDVTPHLSSGSVGAFLKTSLIGVLFYVLLMLGGWAANLVILLGLLALLIGLPIMGLAFSLYGLVKRDVGKIIIGIGTIFALVVIVTGLEFLRAAWPQHLPFEVYVFLVAYPLAVVGAVYWPRLIVGYSLREYRKERATVEQDHHELAEQFAALKARAPDEYVIDYEPETYTADQLKSKEPPQTVVSDGMAFLKAYERHLEHWWQAQSMRGVSATSPEFGLLAVEALHPNRCSNGEVALNAADLLDDLRALQRQLDDPDEKTLQQFKASSLWQTLQDAEAHATVTPTDITNLRSSIGPVKKWIDEQSKYEQVQTRLNELQATFEAALGVQCEDVPITLDSSAPSLDQAKQSSLSKVDRKLDQYDKLASLAGRVNTLADQNPTSTLPESLQALLRAEATHDKLPAIDYCELLVEVSGRALVLADVYPAYPFDHVLDSLQSRCHNPSPTDPADLKTIDEILRSTGEILRFLDTVDHAHPSVEADEWTEAVETALQNQYPNLLRPIATQIEGMEQGLWEAADLYQFDWQAFETLIGLLYEAKGYDVEVTQGTSDGGVDVWATNHEETVAIQVKQHSAGNTVGRRILQQIASTIAKGDADRAIVVTTSSFTNEASAYAREFGPDLQLVDGQTLVRQLSESEIPPPT